MQRYRVNYPLLIGLVVAFVILAPATFFLWRFQVDRNADRLIAKADAAEASGDLEEAYESLGQYVKLRSKEEDAWRRLGAIAVKVAEDEELDMQLRGEAFSILTAAVRETDVDRDTDDSQLRRDLVDLQVAFGMPDVALININQLLDDGKGDPDLKVLKAQCLFATQEQAKAVGWCYDLIGYDQDSKTFVPEKAQVTDKPLVYAMLASYLNEREPELAAQVIDQMLAANPDSVDAYIMQYQFLRGTNKSEEARAALDKAFALKPEEASVLNAKGAEKIADYQAAVAEAQGDGAEQQRADAKKHLDEAAEFFQQGMEKYPDRIDFFERAARIELFQEQPEKALAIIEKGMIAFPMKSKFDRMGLPASIGLANIKSEILIAEKDFDGVKSLIAELRALNNPRVNAVAEFHEARLDAVNEKWAEAAEKLQAVRPQLLGFPDLQALAAAIQGFCQTQLGQFDLALESYKLALDINPELAQAKAGYDQMKAMTNQVNPEENMLQLDREIKEMLARPKAEQDWGSLETHLDSYIDEEAAKRAVPATWAASRKALLRGQMLAMRANESQDPAEQKALFQQARDEIKKAYAIDKNDPTIQIQAIRLLAQEPDSGPAKALELLDSIVSKGKDSAAFRTLRVDLLFAIKDEQLPQQLEAATQDMDDFPDNQKALVWSAVGSKYEQLGLLPDARRCLEQASGLAPTSLPLRSALFDLALRQADDPGMRVAQEKILEIVKSKSDPTYVLTEVKRRLSGLVTGNATKEEVAESRQQLEAAIKQRPAWSDLYVAKGQLALEIDNDVDQALKSFQQAFDLGASNLNAIALQIRLLSDRGRLQEARQTMEKIPSVSWSATLGSKAAEILAATGELDKSFAEAQKIVDSKPEDPQIQAWFADIAIRAQKNDAAEAAMKKAVSLNPEDPDAWTRLVGFYLKEKRPNDVEQTLREAFLALDDEYLPLLTGKYYELQSRWQEAEDLYLAAYSDKLDDPNSARRLAEFYLQWIGANEANRGKAALYLNKLLRAAYEGKLPEGDANGPWARRQAAKLMSQTGDFQDSLKAERLLASATALGAASREDQDQLIDLLSTRPDPVSRQRAVDSLLAAKQQRGSLTPERELQLGDLLFRLNQWEAAKAQMVDLIGRFPNDLRLQTAFASMLIDQKEFDDAAVRISRLDGKPELAGAVSELRLRLAAKKGDKAEVRRALTAMTPDMSRLTEEQLKFVKQLAQTAESVNDFEYAQLLMQEYARRAPDAAFEIARLNALHGNLDEGLAALGALAPQNIDDVSRIAVEVLRARREEDPQKLDEAASRFVRAALRDDPESARRLVLEAEMLEVQEKFDESVEAYKKLLARDDVPKLVRATALNNLAFLLAARSQSPTDLELALNSANEAVELIGPLSDVLDTRALVHLKQQQFAPAVEDMKLAIKVNPTASKYYHLAAALLGTGDNEGAAAAWNKSQAMGEGDSVISKLEKADYEAFSKKMEGIAGVGATAAVQ